MALVQLNLNLSRFSAADITRRLGLDTNKVRYSFRSLGEFITKIGTGYNPGSAEIKVGVTKATGTLTFTDNPANTEAFELGNIVLTAVTSGADGVTEWNIVSGGSAAADAAGNAAAVAAMVNANTTLSKFITASSNAGVATFTIDVGGDIGNAIQFADIDLSNATVSEFVTEDDGDDGTETNLSKL